uniref:Uncharacterized protein n=1 Tax=viral metagenome TaxID=1070528 RepID=A0A6M3JWC8_9ZZZZ
MTDPTTGEEVTGIAIQVFHTEDSTVEEKFMQSQLGNYKMGRDYSFCVECWIDSLMGDKKPGGA